MKSSKFLNTIVSCIILMVLIIAGTALINASEFEGGYVGDGGDPHLQFVFETAEDGSVYGVVLPPGYVPEPETEVWYYGPSGPASDPGYTESLSEDPEPMPEPEPEPEPIEYIPEDSIYIPEEIPTEYIEYEEPYTQPDYYQVETQPVYIQKLQHPVVITAPLQDKVSLVAYTFYN